MNPQPPYYYGRPPLPMPTAPLPPPARPPSNRRVYLVVLAIVVMVAGASAGVLAAFGAFSAKTFTMTGELSIIDTDMSGITTDSNGACEGTDGYSDLVPGTAVIVQDATGRTIATGELEAGTGSDGVCTEPFSIPDVPDGLPAYSVTVSHRGTQVIQAAAAHSDIQLTIGSAN